jgi:hypothetical protein
MRFGTAAFVFFVPMVLMVVVVVMVVERINLEVGVVEFSSFVRSNVSFGTATLS